MIKNKKGFSSIGLVLMILIISSIVVITCLGFFGYLFHQVNNAFDQDINVGQVNMHNVTASTFGKMDTAISNNLNFWAIMILLGGVIGMFVSAYLTRENNPKLFVVFDILIMFFVYILAVYISNMYKVISDIGVTTDIFNGEMELGTIFMLKLPLISIVVGFLSILITYASIPKTIGEINYDNN